MKTVLLFWTTFRLLRIKEQNIVGLRNQHTQITRLRVPGSGDPADHATLHDVGAELDLHRGHTGQEAGGRDRPAQSPCHGGEKPEVQPQADEFDGKITTGAQYFMTANLDHETVKHFVRDTLGCQCPESVFDQIDYQENSAILGKDATAKRLLVGNRLLIYVLEIDDAKRLTILLPRLVRNAKSERDSQGYNRLRVVIAAENADVIRPAAEGLFAEIEDIDAKVHLHVLGKDEVGGLI